MSRRRDRYPCCPWCCRTDICHIDAALDCGIFIIADNRFVAADRQSVAAAGDCALNNNRSGFAVLAVFFKIFFVCDSDSFTACTACRGLQIVSADRCPTIQRPDVVYGNAVDQDMAFVAPIESMPS